MTKLDKKIREINIKNADIRKSSLCHVCGSERKAKKVNDYYIYTCKNCGQRIIK